MKTEEILLNFGNELFFFILKKIKSKSDSDDVFQNVFLKIHKKIDSLIDNEKAKAWAFQIARNEINNYFNDKQKFTEDFKEIELEEEDFNLNNICCFNDAIDSLPNKYKVVIEYIYIKGLKQQVIADKLKISLANVKARVHRGKDMIKKNLEKCCKYELNSKGNLTGENKCEKCG